MKKRLGAFLLGMGALLGIAVAATRGKAEEAPPLSLLQQYLARIAAATTHAELDAILAQATADSRPEVGKLTYAEYYQIYTAYYYRWYQIP